MKEKEAVAKPPGAVDPKPLRVHLPGFLIDEDIGLGDVVKRAIYAVGIKPCGGCEKRAAALNQWMRFSR